MQRVRLGSVRQKASNWQQVKGQGWILACHSDTGSTLGSRLSCRLLPLMPDPPLSMTSHIHILRSAGQGRQGTRAGIRASGGHADLT